MDPHIQTLVDGYFDDSLAEDQRVELNAWVQAAPPNAAAFARAAQLHNRLRDLLAPAPAASALPPRRRRRLVAVSTLAAAAALVLLAFWMWVPARANAQSELDRLINAPPAALDRIYKITSLDPVAEPSDGRQPPIDGAMLSVRSPDQYVLQRQFPDGRPFLTGSDGERSWSISPDGAVRVSADPMRFRGALPGNQQGIPFVDLRSDLAQLRGAYNLTVQAPQPNGWRTLRADKKSPEVRGPRRVELWYDAATGIIHRMAFEGMARARGGPGRLAVDLLEQRDLGPRFFKHESHHAPDRRVIEED